MVDITQENYSNPLAAVKGLSWLVGAAVLSLGAAWGAYYYLGEDISTPVHKAGVVAAGIAGLGVAVWFRTIVQILLIGLVVVLLIWAGNHYYFHK